MPPPPDTTKQQTVARRLAERAHALGPGGRLPTIAALRAEMAVSGNTLMHALDDLEARGILVRKHGVGLFVAHDVHQRQIAMLCDARFLERGEDASPFWSRLMPLAWMRARQRGEVLTQHLLLPDETQTVETVLGTLLTADLRQGRIHGVLGIGLPACVVLWLGQHGIPLVAFAGYAPHRVAFDFAQGVRCGIDALVDRGARRIGLWTSATPDDPLRQTAADALRLRGLTLYPDLVVDAGTPGPQSAPARGAWAVRNAFGPDSDPARHPDALLITEDTLARGALPALQASPHADLPVAAFTNAGSPLLFGMDAGLIRIEYDPARLIDEMMALLTAQRDGRAPADSCVLLPPVLRLPAA